MTAFQYSWRWLGYMRDIAGQRDTILRWTTAAVAVR